MRFALLLLSFIAVISLGGCAAAMVLKEDAGAVSIAVKETVNASRDFYSKFGSQRRRYLTQIVATGPNCEPDLSVALIPDASAIYRFSLLYAAGIQTT